MNPPPPILPAVGWTTASANAVAIAASTAVPPSLIASAPIRDAISLCDTTIPFCARIGTDVALVATVSTEQASATTIRLSLDMSGLYGVNEDPPQTDECSV